MANSNIDIGEIKQYFAEKLDAFGASPRGADWNSQESQYVRFEQLMKVCDPSRPFSIIDYGCGYGALMDYLDAKGYRFQFTGFDILEEMIAKAQQRYKDRENALFTSREDTLQPADYVVESGIFNIRLEYSQETWTDYVIHTLERMNSLSRKGFAFNLLTSYSDPEFMRPHLYYANPGFYFDYCKTHFSKNIALLHDYTLYDFTILVRK